MAQDEPYPSDLKEQEWNIISKLLPAGGKLGRPPRYEKRDILNAILYLVRQGCTWRGLPHDFPPYRIVYYYFAKWQQEGVWERINHALRDRVRGCQRKKKAPSAAIIDSQSVKVAEQPGERGYDAGKKINGRKRHLLVDTLGLILAVVVHSAGVQDREGAKLLLPALLNFGWVRIIFADAGYAGELLHWVADLIPGRGLTLQIIKRTVSGFKILPKRWVVERTFAWLGRYRRLAKDYERKTQHSQATIYVASCKIMLAKLAK
jgi:putative transposase